LLNSASMMYGPGGAKADPATTSPTP